MKNFTHKDLSKFESISPELVFAVEPVQKRGFLQKMEADRTELPKGENDRQEKRIRSGREVQLPESDSSFLFMRLRIQFAAVC